MGFNKYSKNYCCKKCGGYIHAHTALYGKGTCLKCYCLTLHGDSHPGFKSGKPNCKDCGKKLSTYKCIRCQKCNAIYLNFIKWNNGHKCIDCGKRVGSANKRCMDCWHKFCYVKDRTCIVCKKIINKYQKSIRCRNCEDKHKCGKNHPMYGKKRSPVIFTIYDNTRFRSMWEVHFAKWLNCSDIKWKYEYKAFKVYNTTYTPDFYLPEFDCYIEIKGQWIGKAKQKVFNFIKLYPNINFKIFKQKELQKFGIIKWR